MLTPQVFTAVTMGDAVFIVGLMARCLVVAKFITTTPLSLLSHKNKQARKQTDKQTPGLLTP
jgi:hypothetical protein